MSEPTFTLTKEQAALPLPLLSGFPQRLPVLLSSEAEDKTPRFSNDDMFRKKKRNSRSTPAQNYLLVSIKFR